MIFFIQRRGAGGIECQTTKLNVARFTLYTMPLPKQLVYNDLSGDEIKHILEERFSHLLSEVPYLQRHITLPRVHMKLLVELSMWADQPHPETREIDDSVEIISETLHLQDDVNSSPKGGKPPDQIREEHGLAIPTPMRGPLSVEDELVDGKRLTMPSGQVVDRTGSHQYSKSATVVEQDFGPAGLAKGQMNRNLIETKSPRGPVEPPDFSQFGKPQK